MSALLLAACSLACDGIGSAARKMSAAELTEPHPMPSARLLDQNGDTFDLRERTKGKITFLYFGYTYCPDVCPLTMAALSRGLGELQPSERENVEAIFVTLDAARDSPERLDRWLGALDSTFVGLTGEQAELEEVLGQIGFRMPPFETNPGGDYEVPHPATLFLFTPESLGRFGYPAGEVAPDVIAADVRELQKVEW